MHTQRANHHIAIIGCMCLGLLGYTGWQDGGAEASSLPPAAVSVHAPDYDSADSITVIVNKQRPLADPAYAPADLEDVGGALLRPEAAEGYRAMTAEASAAGVPIEAVSGYRRAGEQQHLHDSYALSYGTGTADAISARAGYSEHQTGLSVDIANPGGACAMQACFESTPAGSWAVQNAHRHGFIIRYPAGSEAVTGYAYEPWHLRYVGIGTAAAVHASGAALETYAGLMPAPGYSR